MAQEQVSQTAFDQLVCGEQCQMLKAMIPYLSLNGQKVLSTYTKMMELKNAVDVFSRQEDSVQICSNENTDPMEMLEDIRKFTYGQTRKQLDQISNMMVMLQLLKTVNE